MPLSTSQILTLGAPAICLLLSLAFLCTWLYVKSHRHLLMFSAAFAMYAAGVVSQVMQWPGDHGWNAMVSATMYLASALLLVRGILARARARFDTTLLMLTAAVTLVSVYYFHYVQADLVIRLYALNFGIAGIFLFSTLRLSKLRSGRMIDRLLYWVFASLALSFIPRTMLTADSVINGSLAEFTNSAFWLTMQLTLILFGLALALILFAASMVDIIDRLRQEKNTDALTRLSNRRSFEEYSLNTPSIRSLRPSTLVIFDIDHFKNINDSYGHSAGDAVLSEVGKLIRRCIRADDLAWRVGGEEFIILLPHTNIASTIQFVERIRHLLEQLSISHLPDNVSVTASFGIAQLGNGESLQMLVARADKLLYAAKRGGRNRVVAEHDPQSLASNRLAKAFSSVVPARCHEMKLAS